MRLCILAFGIHVHQHSALARGVYYAQCPHILNMFDAGSEGDYCAGSSNSLASTGMRNLACRTPQPGCFPIPSPTGSFGNDFTRSSGWTQEGRVLQLVGQKLQAQAEAFSYPAPCALACDAQLQASAAVISTTYHRNSSVCFQCAEVTDQSTGITDAYITSLDFRVFAEAGLLQPDQVRFVTEMLGLRHIQTVNTSGYIVQGR